MKGKKIYVINCLFYNVQFFLSYWRSQEKLTSVFLKILNEFIFEKIWQTIFLYFQTQVHVGFIYKPHHYSGVVFQIYCNVRNKKKKLMPEVLAAGGRYDKLVGFLFGCSGCSRFLFILISFWNILFCNWYICYCLLGYFTLRSFWHNVKSLLVKCKPSLIYD